ncbi:hypothetical protein QAD02_010061 [Eretmocerus hayati]|uniref:Uncharacterized protein n=1 Tax=Eretmocerus hayati TaxID=131215 RepID=A0ACC2NBS9_9HYME|nr:hypothetical protein QAD02_010061 [Eretmocerus hayati]
MRFDKSRDRINNLIIILKSLIFLTFMSPAHLFVLKKADQSSYFSNGIDQALSECECSQVLIFLPHFQNIANTRKIDRMIEYAMGNKPTTSVALPISSREEIKMEMYYKVLQNPRSSAIIISIFPISDEHRNSIGFLNDTLMGSIELMSKSSKRIRPKYLIIIETGKAIPSSFIENLLESAWASKFLDVTVLQLSLENFSCGSRTTIESYNPFLDKHSKKCFDVGTQVFPNKLRDMHGYPLEVAVLQRAPDINFDTNSSGHIININGSHHGTLIIMSEYGNFSPSFVSFNATGYEQPIVEFDGKSLIQLISDGLVDLGGNQIFILVPNSHQSYSFGEQSLATWLDDVVIVVPVIPPVSSRIFRYSMILVGGIIFYVLVFHVVVKILRFDGGMWLPNYIVRMILGSSVPRVPVRTAERILFFALLISSQQYAMHLFADFTDSRIDDDSLSIYDSLDDLAQSNIKLVTPRVFAELVSEENGPVFQKLITKLEISDDYTSCPDRAMRSENIVCVVDRIVALDNVAKSMRSNGRKLKILDHVIWTAPKGYVLTESSPYGEEFTRVQRRIEEGGLWRRHIVKNVSPCCEDDEFIKHSTDRRLAKKLLLVWLSGCALSVIVFFIEIMVHRWNQG